ncbi:MAG: citramalate synthase [Verrucomicrobia bacterium]|nr:citramalate synthase [Verrucomicrobiota bacterium]MCG2678675.1 citramalate synthase [Kiritimatiellia bacterium]MBU4248496.1 citramalate synthase [Verrucomicrobiota bacterium]MBU4291308.1 citramalate synthase [Verrucomicrobiota bacterium]MBU4429184.1 citramalate synthase [Verrucomicrobiota bacterium]
MNKIQIYDTTLRDGMQGEGVSLSSGGKIRLALKLDEFGVDYIEGGFAASNPKDLEFFHEISKHKLNHAKIVAFGSTRRAHTPVGEDHGTQKLIEAPTAVSAIFGKSWKLHVTDVLRTSEEENRAMVRDTVRYLKEHGKQVIFDAEHFFDGYKDSPAFAMAVLKAALEAGADCLVLCDTRGGSLPHEIFNITRLVAQEISIPLGIHSHNDGELAVANSIEAVRAGAVHVQGTINGYGERCGNANLCAIIPCLELKMGLPCCKKGGLKKLFELSRMVDNLLNLLHNRKAAYVGESAFAHKAGMHVNAVEKIPRSFEHVDPETVGNERRILISELSGGSNVLLKAVQMGVEMSKSSPEIREVLNKLEQLEKKGYEFEAADASFKLLIQKVLKKHKPFFCLEGFRVIVEKRGKQESCVSEATLKVNVGGEIEHTVGEGDGPVNALDNALRRALIRFYPSISQVALTDYHVRILDPKEATAAKTRVIIESSDGESSWGTVGVSENIIEASWEALVDSMEYKLFMEEQEALKQKQSKKPG